MGRLQHFTQDHLNIRISAQKVKNIYMKGTTNTVHSDFHAGPCNFLIEVHSHCSILETSEPRYKL